MNGRRPPSRRIWRAAASGKSSGWIDEIDGHPCSNNIASNEQIITITIVIITKSKIVISIFTV